MKVLSLGGCGLMGQHFVETAIKLDAFAAMTIADRDLAAASRYVLSLGHPRIDAAQIDARNRADLVALLRRYDVVVSTIGPYYLFGASVLECAIEAGCHYIDICDDPEPTMEMLALDAQARAAGITALIGFGASPGVSNLLAAKAIRTIGQAERVVTTWGSTSRAKEETGGEMDMGSAIDHWIEQLTGTIPVHVNGRTEQGRPLSEIEIRVPGIGRMRAHTVGHPEPLTLPLTYPFIRESFNAMVFSRPLIRLLKLLQRRVDGGRQTVSQAATSLRKFSKNIEESDLTRAESASLALSTVVESMFPRGYLPSEVSAVAERGEGARRRVCSAWLNGEIPGGMGPNTCIPTALTLKLMADGLIPQRGAFSPERAIDPDLFFQRLTPFVQLKNHAAPVVVINTALV